MRVKDEEHPKNLTSQYFELKQDREELDLKVKVVKADQIQPRPYGLLVFQDPGDEVGVPGSKLSFGCYIDIGIPAFWPSPFLRASLFHITLAIWLRVRVRVLGDAHITRVLDMGMPKTQGCPHHSDSAAILGNEKTQGTRFEQISHAAYPACTFPKTAVKTGSIYCAVFTNKAINSSYAQI